MTLTLVPDPGVARAAHSVPASRYTDHPERGPAPAEPSPFVVQRELASLDVAEGMRVLEIGTGCGYSSALLAELTGPRGEVVTLDTDAYHTRWTRLIHHERGVDNVRCVTGDGMTGAVGFGTYDRVVAWCTPPLLPHVWLDRTAPHALAVCPLPAARVRDLKAVVRVRLTQRQPTVEALTLVGDGRAPTTDRRRNARWTDWEQRTPEPSWVSVGWRHRDDALRPGARATLARLLRPGHQEPAGGTAVEDWELWRYWAAARGDLGVTAVRLGKRRAFGHSTAHTVAVLTDDGELLADRPDSPSLGVVRRWLTDWQTAGQPGRSAYGPVLLPASRVDGSGWELRLIP